MHSIKVVSPNWQDKSFVKAFTTTRVGGVSSPPYDTLNLGLNTEDSSHSVTLNQERLITELSLPNKPCYLNQTHGIDVIYNPSSELIQDADAVITDKPNCILAIQTADCLPILLVDNDGIEVAAIHAGWRSLCFGVIENTLSQMKSQTHRLSAWLGPAISKEKFEVGPEVVEQFKKHQRFDKSAHSVINGKDHLSLKSIATMILKKHGVSDIQASPLCTYIEKDRLYSYRRDKTTGRMASLIWLTR